MYHELRLPRDELKTELKRTVDVVNVIDACISNHNSSIARKVLRSYGIKPTSLKKGISPVFHYLNTGELSTMFPVCELHLFRLGILKRLLHVFGRKYGQEFMSKWNLLFKKRIFKDSQKGDDYQISVSRSISGKDIVKIYNNFGHNTQMAIYSKIGVSISKHDQVTEKNIWSRATMMMNKLRKKKSWSIEEIRELRTEIYEFKRSLLLYFDDESWKQPNFENLDILPDLILELGPCRYFSSETYEPLHRTMKKAIRHCNQSNIERNILFTISRSKRIILSSLSINDLFLANGLIPKYKQ